MLVCSVAAIWIILAPPDTAALHAASLIVQQCKFLQRHKWSNDVYTWLKCLSDTGQAV